MTTDQDRDPLYANTRPGDLDDEIIEVGVERRNRVEWVGAPGVRSRTLLDHLRPVDQSSNAAENFERKRLIAWATGPDVRGATLAQLRAMKAVFDATL